MAELEAALKLLSQYGAPLFITAAVLYLMFTRLPKWFDKSNAAQERVAEAVEKQSCASERQSETMAEHCQHMKAVLTQSNVHSLAGYKLSTAAIKIAKKHDMPSDVLEELEAARAMLRPTDNH